MSFCRITGRSRNLPKPHYFPIMKPLSPADAQRICKITGKSYGLPMHHYVPVLLRKTTILTKCRITKVADLYGKRKHYPLDGFKYVRPIIDPDKQKALVDLLMSKQGKVEGESSQFVYTVKERRYSLVFPAPLELAVRDGDIKDVMLAKDADTVLLKMKKGGDISLGIQEINEDEYMDEKLFEGEGVAEETKPKKATLNIAKIFEDKEKQAIEEEVVIKKKVRKENKAAVTVTADDWRNLIQPLLESCDWAQFEQEASKCIEIAKWTPSSIQAQNVARDFNNEKKILSPFQVIQDAVSNLSVNQLEQTGGLFKRLINGGKRVLESLPFVHEIHDIVRKLASGTLSEVKSISGMNVYTDKTRFIVGQMIDTKRGRIFVPGQTVQTSTSNVSFMPGFVVYTNDGPALIPGLILEKQKHNPVFLPGQNVINDQGGWDFKSEQLLISCKDLEVQEVIEVAPEPTYEIKVEDNKEYLQKALLQEVPIKPEVKFKELNSFVERIQTENKLDLKLAEKIAMKYNFSKTNIEDVSRILVIVTHFAKSLFHKSTLQNSSILISKNEESQKNCDILKNALLTAVGALSENPSQEQVYNALSEIFVNLENSDQIIQELCTFLNKEDSSGIFSEIIEQNNHKMPNVSKMDILKSALKTNNPNLLIEKLSTVIEEDLLAPAFCNISKNNTEFLEKVMKTIREKAEINSDQDAYEILQVSIVNAIKESSEQRLNQFLSSEEKPAIKDLLQEAIGLAIALGMNDTANTLYTVMDDPQSTNLLAEDQLTLEILKRLTLMRQIAEKQPALTHALTELKRNPQGARTDPKLRELVRESAVLMVPDLGHQKIKGSDSIPANLFQEHNTLAMEDFVTRNRQPGTLMIIKRGLQAVVPKEASRAVLNGQVAYTLIDETGIKHFQPLDVFTALRLSKPTARRFSGYECLNACEQNRQSNADLKVKDFTNRLLACF